MADWEVIKFFYKTMLGSAGSTLAATSTEATGDHDVDYIFNWLETNNWLAEDSGLADPQFLTYDAGVGNTKEADYICILGHNLNTAGATITLQYSTDNFAGDINDAFTGEAPTADTVYLKEFTSPGDFRYWRLKIAGHGATAPFLTLSPWGLTTELDYATTAFDPYEEDRKANINISHGGFITGIHTKYTERRFTLQFANSTLDFYNNKIRPWREDHGLQNFFVAWETGNNPLDAFLMRSTPRFRNPYTATGSHRDISIQLMGRKE